MGKTNVGVCTCVCMCAQACACVPVYFCSCVYVFACVHGGQGTPVGITSQVLSTCFFETGSRTGLEPASRLDWLASELQGSIASLLLPL